MLAAAVCMMLFKADYRRKAAERRHAEAAGAAADVAAVASCGPRTGALLPAEEDGVGKALLVAE